MYSYALIIYHLYTRFNGTVIALLGVGNVTLKGVGKYDQSKAPTKHNMHNYSDVMYGKIA